MKSYVRAIVAILLLLPMLLPVSAVAQSPVAAISPPGPPETGPGSAEGYVYPGARMIHYGEPSSGFWLVEPTSDASGATPVTSEPLPVILHFNGCCGDGGYPTPNELEAWFTHLARQGHVVIAPVYATYSDDSVLDSSVKAFQDAQDELAKPGHAAIDLDKLAVTAYSYGSPAALKYTATAAENGWPIPKAYFAMGPCEGRMCLDVPEIDSLPAGLKAVVMAFDIDDVPGVEWPQRLYQQLMSLPETDRAYIELRSDDHGWPALLATHYTGITNFQGQIPLVADYYAQFDQPDALDTWGIWKVSSGLFDCAFSGANCEYALGSSDELLNMGVWSDGVPVRPLTVTTDPLADWALDGVPVDANAESFATLDPAFDPLVGVGFPQQMVFGPDGRFYVMDARVNDIKVLDDTWKNGDRIGKTGDGPGQFSFHPPDIPYFGWGDLAFASDGTLYVTDTYNSRVQVFDPQFNVIREIGSDPNQPGALMAPTSLALDEANGRLFVADFTGGAIDVYSLDGDFVERWGRDGVGGAYFDEPADVKLAPDGSVYVVEEGRSRVHHFATDGTPISVFGGNGLEPGHLAEPAAITFDAYGNLYVTEYNILGYGGTRVQVFSPDGTVIGIISGPSDHQDFTGPKRTMIGPDGAIYIADEQGNHIYRYLRNSE